MDKLIATKLFRPQPSGDFVPRRELFQRLENGTDHFLTLVSAPPGYGKSVTVSGWLEEVERPSTWLSLSSQDDDPALFFNLIVAALEKVFPGRRKGVTTYIKSADEFSIQRMSELLLSYFQELQSSIIVVLDDIGFIHNQSIFDILDSLVANCPRNLQLVMISRRDPPLSLQNYRLAGLITELRQVDLKFGPVEVAEFFLKSKAITLTSDEVEMLHQKIEGWPAGIRLFSLGITEDSQFHESIQQLQGDNREIREYLLLEVLEKLSADAKDILLKTSVARKFNGAVFDIFCEDPLTGETFLAQIIASNLFCEAIDPAKNWFRYHHLFRDLLLWIFEKEYDQNLVKEVHLQLASFYERNEELEEVIYHYVEIGENAAAVRVVEKSRHSLMNQERWERLGFLMGMLPDGVTDSPAILATRAFHAENRFMIAKSLDCIERLEKSCFGDSGKGNPDSTVMAELDALRSMKYYFRLETDKSIESGLRAIQNLPDHCASVKGFAQGLSAFSWQMQGDSAQALQQLSLALESCNPSYPTLKGRILLIFCFIYWFEGDLQNLVRVAERYSDFADQNQLVEANCFAQYFLGIAAYQRNELTLAEKYLEDVLRARKNINITADVHNEITLAQVMMLSGSLDEAAIVSEGLLRQAYDLGNSALLHVAQSFQAELELQSGRKRLAAQWLTQIAKPELYPVYRMYSPYITEMKVRIALGEEDGFVAASTRLEEMILFFEKSHQKPMLIELYALAAKIYHLQGKNKRADDFFYRALVLSSPGRFVNIFRSMEDDLQELLSRQVGSDINPGYLELLQAAYGGQDVQEGELNAHTAAHLINSGELLSDREFQVLALFPQRLSNKEIASELFISVNTVKRHAINIYKKLEVHNRREAVNKARMKGLLH